MVQILFHVRCTTWRAAGLTINTLLQLHSYIDLQPLPCSLYFQARVVYTTVNGQNIVTQSVAGIATGYGLGGPGIESPGGRDFLHLYRPALGTTQPTIQRVPGLSRGVKWPGRGTDYLHTSSAEVNL